MMVVAVLGTTISPYLFFWQASQEVEEMNKGTVDPPLRDVPENGKAEINRITLDTVVGMIFSNGIAFFIILTTAAVLHSNGITEIKSAADAANALRPLAGDLAFTLFALGIIGTGLLAIPVLAGSAAYAVAEAMGWTATLEAKATQAKGFYTIIAAATVIGLLLGFSPLDPMKMLVWSAVLNGIVAVPIMVAMMLVATNRKIMKRFVATSGLKIFGWIGTGLMTLAVIAMGVSALL
jgi:Mn2+/Fe2+ NRAMP family transporter